MFAKELRQAGHTKRFTISQAGSEGWEVRVEQDSQVVRRVHYTDWHRVERAALMMRFRCSSWKAERLAREPAELIRAPGGARNPSFSSTPLLHEAVAQTDHGLDLLAGGAELGAQPADVDVDRSRLDEAVVAPDALEQAVARQDAIAVLDEELAAARTRGASAALPRRRPRWRPRRSRP